MRIIKTCKINIYRWMIDRYIFIFFCSCLTISVFIYLSMYKFYIKERWPILLNTPEYTSAVCIIKNLSNFYLSIYLPTFPSIFILYIYSSIYLSILYKRAMTYFIKHIWIYFCILLNQEFKLYSNSNSIFLIFNLLDFPQIVSGIMIAGRLCLSGTIWFKQSKEIRYLFSKHV